MCVLPGALFMSLVEKGSLFLSRLNVDESMFLFFVSSFVFAKEKPF